MGEPPTISLPESIRDVEPVRSVRTPARLDFVYTAGDATTRFLQALAEKRIIGGACAGAGRSTCRPAAPTRSSASRRPRRSSSRTRAPSLRSASSTCSSTAQVMEIPYTSALIKLDGSDLPLMHLLQEVPTDEVRIGMRVEAVWVDDDELAPTLESIKYFRPNGEPDVEVLQPGEGVTW